MALELEVVNIAGEKVCAFRLGETLTLPELQAAIEAKTGIRASRQRLLHGTRELLGAGCLDDLLHGCSREVPLTIVRVPRTPEQAEWLERLTDGRRRWPQLQNAPAEVEGDRDCVLAALAQDGNALEYASTELQADWGVVVAAVQKNGEALRFASAELRADRGVVLAAVQRHGYALEFASAELQADRGVVLAAMHHWGYALQFASAELRADRGVVFAAVQQRGDALWYASAELRANRGVVLAAMQQNGDSLRFASAWLQTTIAAPQAMQRMQSSLWEAWAAAAQRCCCRS